MAPRACDPLGLACVCLLAQLTLLLGPSGAMAPSPFLPFVSPSQSDSLLDLLIASESSRNYRKSNKQSTQPGKMSSLDYSSSRDYGDLSSGSLPPTQTTGDYWSMATPAAVHTTQHAIGLKEVDLESEPFSPQTVLIDATVMPLTIFFRSTSSMVKVIQEHLEAKGDIQHSQSEEEPHRLYHVVNKPIIQEVHEVIKPFRRIIQEMQPVYEDVKTIISRPSEDTRSPRPLYEPIQGFEQNRFNSDRYSGYLSPMQHEDLHRITLPSRDEYAKDRVNMTAGPKSQSSGYAESVPNDLGHYDRAKVRDERHSGPSGAAQVEPTPSNITTSSTTTPPTTTSSEHTHKHKRHRASSKQHVVKGSSASNFSRSRRLAIKKLVNKIDREKRKIRLGFFGLYGINLIPYIYDQFHFDVKIRVPSRPAPDQSQSKQS